MPVVRRLACLRSAGPSLTVLKDAPWRDGLETALIYDALSWDYAELHRRALKRAAWLRAQRVEPGQVVLVADAPGVELVLMQHALARIGAALLPYRAGLASAELLSLAAMTGAEWHWRPESRALIPTGCRLSNPHDAASSIALLIKTSGSSGTPKVAMLTSSNLLASATHANAHLGLTVGDIWLACLRLSHIGGISIGYRCALAGATLLLHDGFDAQTVQRDLQRWPVTHLSLVPPMLARLLDLDLRPPPSLRVLLVGGQSLSRTLAQRALDAGWPLYLTYGMTETASHLATTKRLVGEVPAPGRVGRPLPNVEIDAGSNESAPAPLRLRGAVVMAGYANPQRIAGQGLDDGWFTTADLACMSEDGQLKVIGRADDILVIGGNNVSRLRVEAVLQRVAGITDLLVVALPDPIWGHRLVAVYTGTIAQAELERICREQLAGAECPRAVLHWPRLPVLDSGKYDRTRITAIANRLCR